MFHCFLCDTLLLINWLLRLNANTYYKTLNLKVTVDNFEIISVILFFILYLYLKAWMDIARVHVRCNWRDSNFVNFIFEIVQAKVIFILIFLFLNKTLLQFVFKSVVLIFEN